jgi:integral membrane sensor domain MASE1
MNPRVRFVGALTSVTLAYVLSGRVGLEFAHVNASTSAVWPAAGIAVAALLILGLRVWPALLLGSFLTNLFVSEAVPAAAIAAGNTSEYVLAALLATRFARGVHAFDRGSRILRFTAVAALAAPLVAASVGTIVLRLSGLASQDDTFLIWLTWWLGDAAGISLVTHDRRQIVVTLAQQTLQCAEAKAFKEQAITVDETTLDILDPRMRIGNEV